MHLFQTASGYCGCQMDCLPCGHAFTICKRDSVTGAVIPGAQFSLAPLCSVGTQVGTTDAHGLLTFRVGPCARYILTETAAPSGYTPNTTVYTVCVGANGCVTVNGIAVSIFDIFNAPIRTFSITYLANGGTGQFTESGLTAGTHYIVKRAAETGISRTGFTFVSWNTAPDGSGTTYLPGDVIPVSRDLSLYAQWMT
ncbi:MAG: InlB B-repeat-containing protein [Oscillospiraceae bacterium]|nr:InlB B-repeat-containing protein [Oscillospiraceae bacterium]